MRLFMKTRFLLLLGIFSILILGGCAGKSQEVTTVAGKADFYDFAWELEYISGPRIAFDGLYPEKKPFIMFKDLGKQFSGNTSCNGYSGKYTKKDNKIHFGDVIKTMIFCEGGGEEIFLKMLGSVDRFALHNGKLILQKDGVTVMRFKKIAKPQHQ